MAQRKSGHARIPAELYQTPSWVLDVLAEHVALDRLTIWEPACGEGKMVRALEAHGAIVFATDALDHGFEPMRCRFDFTGDGHVINSHHGIVTNPPYGPQGRTAEKFIERGIERLQPGGFMALLLQADFDSAGGRKRLFTDCPEFAGRIVLNRRIVWFEPEPREDGKKPSGPSQNHTWFLWSKPHIWTGAPPFTLYGPGDPDAA